MRTLSKVTAAVVASASLVAFAQAGGNSTDAGAPRPSVDSGSPAASNRDAGSVAPVDGGVLSGVAGSFDAFLAGVRKDARARGVSDRTLAALDGLQPIEKVIELDRRQPHKTMTFARYLEIILTEERITKGRQQLAENRELLERISEKYGVQPEIIVALWGVETKYGAVMGDFSIVGALATLAWEGRRGAFFRAELMNALQILDQGHIEATNMKGSWAGAMGHCQFMPSTFLRHAADGDGDGRRDIWTTRADVFASASNYLSKIGWDGKIRWGREVVVPAKLDRSWVGMKQARPISFWRKQGLKDANGGELPDEAAKAWLIQPDGEGGRAVLAYANFKSLLDWNRSHYFAAGVGLLADRIAAAEPASEAGTSPRARSVTAGPGEAPDAGAPDSGR